MYKIELSRSAYKWLKMAPGGMPELAAIKGKIMELAENPKPPGCEKLRMKEDYYRIRHGNYRVVYEISVTEKKVIIVAIGHRREIYRGI
ncbi:MAG: type II toxin-antitoxin system mRNA interferase toxin, RelE/StbE family [Candidatus Goldiibacteriota bacterium HGW-Goldbacteria-1]|jgi:mRNA interferase RelE/StbE|nr:MAG: type II toxin-antitoxin system mRNA interferase toxin, RelE/StbE family [Candidatus Goldiibacteriota bacterium HGW-Goldbacteria-1]